MKFARRSTAGVGCSILDPSKSLEKGQLFVGFHCFDASTTRCLGIIVTSAIRFMLCVQHIIAVPIMSMITLYYHHG
jgi:hypothetical protein